MALSDRVRRPGGDRPTRRLRDGFGRWVPAAGDAGRPVGAATVFAPWQRASLLAGFALLVVLRLPRAWLHGRFLDEEATVFLAYAWHRPWIEALFRPFAGYWNLGANATTLLVARLVQGGIVPLERAPYLTMTMALAVQLLPAILVLTGRATWLAGRAAAIAALLVIAIAPATEEVFLNVLHIQFHLALCAGLILALDVPARRAARIGYALLLFLGPLCGPGAIVILPLFGLRALIDRDRGRLAQAAAFGAGAAVQLLFFYGSNPMRGHLLDPGTIAAVMCVRLIVLPLLGYGKANRIGEAIYDSQMAGGTGWWWSVVVTLIFFSALLVLAARRRDAAIWLVLSGLAIAAVSFGFGMVVIDRFDLFSAGAGERYDFLPLVTLGLATIALAMRPQGRTRPVWAILCLALLINGATRYTRPLGELSQGPSWAAEVAAWRRDHRHGLAAWPAQWLVDLSDTPRACSPIGKNPAQSTDPRYCESGWVAAFFHRPPVRR